jgi:hypothetical protein
MIEVSDSIWAYEPDYAIPYVVRLTEEKSCQNIVTWLGVTVDWFCIYDWIYWTLWYSAWLQFTFHYYMHTDVQNHVFTKRCFVVASNVGGLSYSGFRNYPRASTTSFSQQQLSDWTPAPNPPAYNISARTTQKAPFLFLWLRAAS